MQVRDRAHSRASEGSFSHLFYSGLQCCRAGIASGAGTPPLPTVTNPDSGGEICLVQPPLSPIPTADFRKKLESKVNW